MLKCLVKHFHMVQTQIDQLTKVQKDLLAKNSNSNGKHAFGIATRSGAFTQDPLYPEGHPKRIEQDSQRVEKLGTPSKRKKKKHKTAVESSETVKEKEPASNPNSISVSDAETESGNEPVNDNDRNNDNDNEEVESDSEK